VRLPKEFRFDDDEVSVQKYGEGILILPIAKSMFVFRSSIKNFSEDFMSERNQPEMQKRENF
jgi:antitoxin VapB